MDFRQNHIRLRGSVEPFFKYNDIKRTLCTLVMVNFSGNHLASVRFSMFP